MLSSEAMTLPFHTHMLLPLKAVRPGICSPTVTLRAWDSIPEPPNLQKQHTKAKMLVVQLRVTSASKNEAFRATKDEEQNSEGGWEQHSEISLCGGLGLLPLAPSQLPPLPSLQPGDSCQPLEGF